MKRTVFRFCLGASLATVLISSRGGAQDGPLLPGFGSSDVVESEPAESVPVEAELVPVESEPASQDQGSPEQTEITPVEQPSEPRTEQASEAPALDFGTPPPRDEHPRHDSGPDLSSPSGFPTTSDGDLLPIAPPSELGPAPLQAVPKSPQAGTQGKRQLPAANPARPSSRPGAKLPGGNTASAGEGSSPARPPSLWQRAKPGADNRAESNPNKALLQSQESMRQRWQQLYGKKQPPKPPQQQVAPAAKSPVGEPSAQAPQNRAVPSGPGYRPAPQAQGYRAAPQSQGYRPAPVTSSRQQPAGQRPQSSRAVNGQRAVPSSIAKERQTRQPPKPDAPRSPWER